MTIGQRTVLEREITRLVTLAESIKAAIELEAELTKARDEIAKLRGELAAVKSETWPERMQRLDAARKGGAE